MIHIDDADLLITLDGRTFQRPRESMSYERYLADRAKGFEVSEFWPIAALLAIEQATGLHIASGADLGILIGEYRVWFYEPRRLPSGFAKHIQDAFPEMIEGNAPPAVPAAGGDAQVDWLVQTAIDNAGLIDHPITLAELVELGDPDAKPGKYTGAMQRAVAAGLFMLMGKNRYKLAKLSTGIVDKSEKSAEVVRLSK